MSYLILGSDQVFSDKKIEAIRLEVVGSQADAQLDYDRWHAHKLDSDDLQKSFLALPAYASQRLVVILQAHKLSKHNLELVQRVIDEKPKHVVLVLESNHWEQTTAFVKKIRSKVEVLQSRKASKPNVFDMTRLMNSRQSGDALQMLHVILKDGSHPLQIMGGLVWFWGKKQGQIDNIKYKKGLQVLQEADLNIKRSRMNLNYAIETAVVKLSHL